MPTWGWMLASSAVSVLIFALGFAITRRRSTPYVKLDPDAFPPIDQALPMLAGLTESCVYYGNTGRVLQNGTALAVMLADIRAARRTVHFETFVWAKGQAEKEFVDALCAKAAAGIKVRVLIDSVGGGQADPHQIKRLCGSGVTLANYCSPRWWNWNRFNHRTHRKLLILDGEIGWAFGHGVRDQWLGDGTDPEHYRDTALRLEGPVVHGLQSVFAQNWVEETHNLPVDEGVFPKLEKRGDMPAHVVSSAAGDAVSSVAMLYTIAIAMARREVLIQNPYFAPDDGVIDLFKMVTRRGVTVKLMVPGKHTDNPFVRRAGCHLYEGLMHAGVQIYEFAPTLLHQKVVVVDELWSHVGSTNFDSRSLALNEEVGVGICNREIAMELKAAFNQDLRHCKQLQLQEWMRRPLHRKAFEVLAYLAHDQL
jgi:cardiolipin synthase